MKRNFGKNTAYMTLVVAIFAVAYLTPGGTVAPSRAAEGKLDTVKIEQLTGAKGTFNEREGVFK